MRHATFGGEGMNMLNKPLKPYYSLEKVADRLNRAGDGEIVNAEDILLLAKNDQIQLSLLCDEQLILLNTKYATAIDINWPDVCDSYDINNLVNFDIYEPGEISNLFEELETKAWLSCDAPTNQPFSDALFATNKPFATPFQSIDVTGECSVLSPNSHPLNESAGENIKFFGTGWTLSTSDIGLSTKSLTVVDINDEQYYVCRVLKNNPLSKGMNFINRKNEKTPITHLYCALGMDSFEASDYVVTNEEIVSFEQKYIHNQLDKNSTGVGDKIPVQKQREGKLVILKEEHGADKLKSFGRVKVWAMLSKYDQHLFIPGHKSTNGTLKEFFREQKLITL